MTNPSSTTPCLFEIHHGETVIRIADDWSGHVLIEQLYNGLREARQSRDAGHAPLAPPAPGSEAANFMIEEAISQGFRQIDHMTYQASADQIVALLTAAREHGRKERQA